MAKAGRQLTPSTWTWLRDAYPFVLEICGSPQYCGPWLAEQIAADRVRWRAKATNPRNEPLDGFWQGSTPSIDFPESTATKLVAAPPGTVVGPCPIILLGIEIVREDIEAFHLVPPKKANVAPQQKEVLRFLRQLYPPDGKVPDSVRTATVQGQVANAQEQQARAKGMKPPNPPSWTSVHRALGRRL